MQSTIYFMVAVVAFTTALQVKSEPQGSIASSSSKSNNKRYATQEFTLFLTPSEIKRLSKASYSANKETEVQSPKENPQYILRSYSQPEPSEWQKFFKQPSFKQSKNENQDLFSARPILQEPSPVYENQEERFDPYNFYQEQNSAEQQEQNSAEQQEQNSAEQQEQSSQKSNDKQDVIWIQYNPISKSQEESLIHEDLQQQWNRLLEHNRGQLKALSSADSEKQISEDSSAKKESNVQSQFSQNEQNNSEIKKEIQFSSKNQAADFSPDNSRAEEQAYVLRSPFLIHKEVKVTKHLPVPVIQKVHVKVPTPVLVPVPEPYEVKVPHPYPVPYEIIKHIPVPIIKKY